MRSDRFGGRVALVTGGASGIGRATVETLACEGAAVVVADIDTDRGEELASRLSGYGARVVFHRTDVTDPDQVFAMVAATRGAFGPVDVLVNNAGGEAGSAGGPVLPDGVKMTMESWRATFDLNVTAPWLTTTAVIDDMVTEGGGAIVNVSSMLAVRHTPTQSVAYAASKAAVIRLTEVTAARYAQQHVRVNCVAPGLTRTETLTSLLTPEQLAEAEQFATAVKHAGRPGDQAAAICFLCSDEAAYITGQTIRVDGGWSVT